MKNTGIVRRVDELGRIVLPAELRQTMELPVRTPVEIYVDGDMIVLHKYQPGAWCPDELREALAAAAKDAGRDPEEYLKQVRKRG